MKSNDIKFLTPSYNGVQIHTTGNVDKEEDYKFVETDEGKTYLGSDSNIKNYVYIFSSAELSASELKLIQNNPYKNMRNKYFWLQKSIFIAQHGEYHFIDVPGSVPISNRGYTAPVLTAYGINNNIPIDNYFCVSRVNFNENRIKKLLDELVKGNYTRFEKINIAQSPAEGGVYQVTLTDYLGVAQWLHLLYVKKYDEYLEWATNERRTLLRTINDMMDQIKTNNGNIDFDKCLFPQPISRTFAGTIDNFEEWGKKDAATEKNKKAEYEKYCIVLTKFWLTKKEFLAVLEDYDDTEELQGQREKELEACLADINMSEAGRIYLQNMVNNPDGNWIFKYVFEILSQANDTTWAIMGLFTTEEYRAIDTMIKAVSGRLRNIGVVVSIEGSQRTVGSASVTQLGMKVYKNGILVDNITESALPEGLKIVLSMINLFLLLYNNKGTDKSTETVFTITKDAGDIIGNLLIISGKIIKIKNLHIGTTLIKVGRGAFGITALVSSVFSVINMTEARNKGDNSVVVGHALGAASGLLTAISYFCLTFGVATIIAPPCLILSAVLGLSGAIIVITTKDEPIVTWFKKSVWGLTPFDHNYWNGRASGIGIRIPNNSNQYLELQLAELQQIVYRFEIDLKGDRISILSSYMSKEHTGIYLYVWRRDSNGGDSILFRKKIDNSNIRRLPHSNTNRLDLIIINGTRESVIGNTVTVPYLEDERKRQGNNVYCAVFMDIFGDGSAITPYHYELQNNLKRGNPNIPLLLPKVIDSDYKKKL
jgi:hypothetical protein